VWDCPVIRFIRLVAIVIVLGTVLPGSVRAEEKSVTPDSLTEIHWIRSYSRAVNAATSSSRHVIALFYTDWCPWCQRMLDSTFTDPRVIALQKRFLFAQINAELDTATAKRFKVSGYPTVILLEPSGNEVDRVRGYMQPEQFATTMVNSLEGIGTLWALQQKDREDRNNPKILYAIGQKYLSQGNIGDARSNLERVTNIDPDNQSGYSDSAQFALAVMFRNEREWYKAAEGFRKLLKDYPDSEMREDAQLYLGWLYSKAGDTKEALKSYDDFLDDYSGSSEKEWVENQISLIEKAQEEEKKQEEQADQQGAEKPNE
jgi:thioredoxin-like negative regulator of GroEL